jgi:NAD(P)-dependent dehydrogenase (short-subunit alcohol dehydrogenase family)
MRGLDGKVIIITGGCGDIGAATARQLAREGARVTLLDLMGAEEGSLRARQIGAAGYRQCDQGDRRAIDAVLGQLAAELPRLDVVIANAAVAGRHAFQEIPEEAWNEHVRVNLSGCFHVAQAAVRIMLRQAPDADGIRGKILFTSSWVAQFPVPSSLAYVVTKAGVDALTRAMAQELAGSQIRVNALAPGILYAGLTRKLCEQDPSLKEKLLAMIPLNALGAPEDVAKAYAFLCSNESNYMTGQVLTVDGGCSVIKRDLNA